MSSSFSNTLSQTNSQAISNTFKANLTQSLNHSQAFHSTPKFTAMNGIMILIAIILYIFLGYCLGLIFRKAGRKMWAGFVPIYNLWVMFEITDIPAWLSILSLVPFVNIIPAVIEYIALYRISKNFSKSVVFYIIGLIFFPYVGLPILAFGKSTYASNPGTGANNANNDSPMNNPQWGGGTPQYPMNQDFNKLPNQPSNNPSNPTYLNQAPTTNPEMVQAQTMSNQNVPGSNQSPPPYVDLNSNANSNLGVNSPTNMNGPGLGVAQPPEDHQTWNDPNNPTTPTNP